MSALSWQEHAIMAGALTFVINDLIALYGKPSNNQFQFLGSGN